MEIDEDERTQHETSSYHSLRSSLSLDDLRTALHNTSPCTTAVSLTRIVDGSQRWHQFLTESGVDQIDDLPSASRNQPQIAIQQVLESVIARIHEENVEPSLRTARRHSFQLNDGDTFVLEIPSADLDQVDDPWAPPNTPMDESIEIKCTTTCSTMDSVSPSASRERIAGEVAEYLLIKGGAWHSNVNDSVRVEMTQEQPDKQRGVAAHSGSKPLLVDGKGAERYVTVADEPLKAGEPVPSSRPEAANCRQSSSGSTATEPPSQSFQSSSSCNHLHRYTV